MSKKLNNPFQLIYQICNSPMAMKQRKLLDFPRMLDVELTNKCNMTCAMCPTGQNAVKRPKGYMDMKLFKRILKQAVLHKTPIRFIRWGEPLLHPRVVDMVKATTDAGLMCHINTNGLLLDMAMMLELLSAKLTSIKFSFQGVDAAGFNAMRRIDAFDGIVERIRLLYELRTEKGLSYPFIQVGTTLTCETEAQAEAFERLLDPFTDAVYVGRTRNLSEANLPDKACECPEVWDKLSIDWDGRVSACCGDYDRLMTVGDATLSPLRDIWYGPLLNHYRDKLAAYKHGEMALCSKCARSL